MLNAKKIPQILGFWFQKADLTVPPTKSMSQKWWSATEDINKEIRETYSEDLQAALEGKLQSWKEDRDGRLAYVILCDQLSRNAFKGKAGSFATDHLSLNAAKQTFSKKELLDQYQPCEKGAFLMPLMHSENKEDSLLYQKYAEELIELCKLKGYDYHNYVTGTMQFWNQHNDIVQKFGRYPHRNEVLGRESTAEEIEWLKTGTSFGFSKK